MEPRNEIDDELVNLSQDVYQEIGPGMREKVYQNGLNLLLNDNHKTILEYPISVDFRGHCMSLCYPDIYLRTNGGERILLEIKAISKIQLKEKLQILGYMRHSGITKGYLINFGTRELEVIKYHLDTETDLIDEEF